MSSASWSRALLGCVSLALAFQGTTAAQDATPTKPPQVSGTVPSTGHALTDEPKSKPATAFAEGLELYRHEDYGGAFSKFSEAGDSKAEDPAQAYAWAARAALKLKRPTDAEANAKKALQLNPDLPTAQSAMGEVFFRQGKFPEAEDLYRKILLAKIEDPRARLGLANIYSATAYYKSAKALIDHARQLDSEDPDIFWAWLATLSPKDRLAPLKARLAAGIPGDPEERAETQMMLGVLEDLEQKPERSCKLVTTVDSMETSLERFAYDPKHLTGAGLLVKLNDKNARLLIDTGAGGITISSKVAERAGVERVVDQKISGIGDQGPASGYVGYARRIQIGTLQFENCYLDVVDRKRALDVDGLIGPNAFEDFLVDLNFPDNKLILTRLPPYPDEQPQTPGLHSDGTDRPNLHNRFIPPAYAGFEKVFRIDHMLLLPTRLNDAPYKLFLLDTGAYDNNVTPSAAREASKVYSDPYTKVKGLSGEVKKVYSTGDITLSFGKFRQKRDDLIAIDMTHISDDVGTEISGLLGFAMLYLLDIQIDYRDNLVNFTYDPYRFH